MDSQTVQDVVSSGSIDLYRLEIQLVALVVDVVSLLGLHVGNSTCLTVFEEDIVGELVDNDTDILGIVDVIVDSGEDGCIVEDCCTGFGTVEVLDFDLESVWWGEGDVIGCLRTVGEVDTLLEVVTVLIILGIVVTILVGDDEVSHWSYNDSRLQFGDDITNVDILLTTSEVIADEGLRGWGDATDECW